MEEATKRIDDSVEVSNNKVVMDSLAVTKRGLEKKIAAVLERESIAAR